MIWFGALILYGKRVKFMIEFNAHKNEWVEFPLWLREQLEQYLATNRETPMSYLIPRFRYRPRIEVFPPDDIDLAVVKCRRSRGYPFDSFAFKSLVSSICFFMLF